MSHDKTQGSTQSHSDKGVILIVDDNLDNRRLLGHLVEELGYQAVTAPSGPAALETLDSRQIDLILLDILMPEMSGFEVLEQLRNHSRHQNVPVIVISALHDQASIVRGIEAGAIDYLTKPFDQQLLKARIHAGLAAKRLNDKEREYRRRLERTVATKTRELEQANLALQRLEQAKSDFLRLISHELRTPLNTLGPAVESLISGRLDAEGVKGMQNLIKCSTDNLQELIEQASMLSQVQLNQKGETPIHEMSLIPLLKNCLDNASHMAERRGVVLEMPTSCKQTVLGEEMLLSHALRALLKTALKLAERDSTINIRCDCIDEYARVVISVCTWPLDQTAREEFFSLFHSHHIHTAGGNLGLSPALGKRIIDLFDGTVTIDNNALGNGVVINIYLPAALTITAPCSFKDATPTPQSPLG